LLINETVFQFEKTDEADPFFYAIYAGISRCDGSYRIQRNNAQLYAVEYIIEGEGFLEIDGKKLTPKKGDTFITHLGSNHQYGSSEKNPWEKIWIGFKGRMPDALFAEYGLEHTYLVENCNVEVELRDILNMAKNEIPERQRQQETSLLVHNLLHQIYSIIEFRTHTLYDTIDRTIAYMRMNLHNMLSLDTIASHVNKSKSQLINLFKDRTGQTPYEYFLEMKIRRAQMLLHGSSFSIQQIAEDLGFHDAFHFSNTFKARTGDSPSIYRKRRRTEA
jgi:AraC family transcriptional regulator, arabinose operon regulatory protein